MADLAGGEHLLAVERLQQLHLGIRRQSPAPLADIGELVAGGIDLEVVGVAHECEALFADKRFGWDPGVHQRTVGIVVLGVVTVGADTGFPPEAEVALARFGHHLRDAIGVVVGIELLEVVPCELGDPDAIRGRQVLQEQPVGRTPREAEGQVVDHVQGRQFALDVEVAAGAAGVDVLSRFDLFPPKRDIGGGKGMTVTPLQALPQVEGIGGGIVVDLPALGDVGNDFATIGAPTNEVFIAELTELRQAATPIEAEELAAVLTDLIGGFDHPRVHRQAFGDGRELTCRHQGGQLGGFMVFLTRHFLCRSGECQHKQCCQHGYQQGKSTAKIHVFIPLNFMCLIPRPL